MKNRWLIKACLINAFFLVSGCMSNVKDVMHTDRDMKDVIGGGEKVLREERESVSRPINNDLVGYTRTAANESQVLFPELPNPRLVMYVYPHITAENSPIPGYSVPLYFYEEPQFAMPGEIYGWE